MVQSLESHSPGIDFSFADRISSLRWFLPYLAVALLSGLYLFPFLRTIAWNPDEGIYLYGAQITAHGAIPGRDFVELQGPGTFYWLALFFRLFGTTLLTARSLLLMTGALTAALIFHLSRRVGGMGLFAAIFVTVTCIPLGVMNSPHYDSNLFALLALAVFGLSLRQLDTPSSGRYASRTLFAAGALAGLTTCFLQQKGFYMAASFVLALVLLQRRSCLQLAGMVVTGYICVVGAEFLFYLWTNALSSLIYANLIWPLSTYESVNQAPYGFSLRESLWRTWFAVLHATLPTPVAFIGATLFSVPYLLILVVPLLLPAIAFTHRALAFRRELAPYWIAGYALWASEIHRWDLGHLRNGCVILVILFFVICERQGQVLLNRLALTIAACLVLTGAANLLGASFYHVPVHTRRGTLYALKTDPALEFLLAHTHPGEKVFVYPYASIYYFVADIRNPTRWSNLMYGINTNDQFREAVHDVDRQSVRYVLWDTVFSGPSLATLFPAYHHPPAAQLIMEPYLESHYHQVGFENGFRILERNN